MYSAIVSGPSCSATCAQTVFTEFVNAAVSVIRRLRFEKFCSGAPEISIGDEPSTTDSGVNPPLSSAAAAVTTFIVEPGGEPPCVARLSSGESRWPGP